MNYWEILGALVGLVYLWLEYKASIYLWIASIVMPAIYVVVYYRAGLYADWGMNMYYLLASIYGWLLWMKGKGQSSQIRITSVPHEYAAPLFAVFIVLWLLTACILIYFTDSDVPWADSFTTSLSIIALWMLARKFAEQWLAWIGVDIVCCGLYIYKELYFTSALYGLYAMIAVLGYKKWKCLMKENAA